MYSYLIINDVYDIIKDQGGQMSKITAERIIDKVKELPEADQQTILDFIEYLVEKYQQKQDKKSGNKKKT